MPQNPDRIFDPCAQGQARRRAAKRQARKGVSFLLVRACADAASRISDISRQFQRAVLIGPQDLRRQILSDLAPSKHPAAFDHCEMVDDLSGDYDLTLNLLELQSEEDVPGKLQAMRGHLRPDGLLLLATFGGASLTELRQSLYTADQVILGGVSARVYPFMDHTQAAGLLGAAGLALPVVDIDRLTVSYARLSGLVDDLRDLGLTNTLSARTKMPLGKGYIKQLERTYVDNFSRDDGKLQASFEILWLTGWAPHDSQQKPLKSGSAKMRLADALKTRETKL